MEHEIPPYETAWLLPLSPKAQKQARDLDIYSDFLRDFIRAVRESESTGKSDREIWKAGAIEIEKMRELIKKNNEE